MLRTQMLTRSLFLEDSYRRDCEGAVNMLQREDGSPSASLVLDQTVMQPDSRDGCDSGTIEGLHGSMTVKRVVKRGDDIVHFGPVTGTLPEASTVKVRIDWARRYLHMRRHGMFHLLYSCARTVLQDDFVALSRVAGDGAYTDWLGRRGTGPELLRRSVEMALAAIAERRKIATETLPRALALVRCGSAFEKVLPKHADDLRLVTIEGFKSDPCIGLHVRATDEIGPFEIERVETRGQDLRLHADVLA